MLQDIINQKIYDTTKAQDENQRNESEVRKYCSDLLKKADRLAAEEVYRNICQAIADQIAEKGEQDITGSYLLSKAFVISHIGREELREGYGYDFFNKLLSQEGIKLSASVEGCDVNYSLWSVIPPKLLNNFWDTKYEVTGTLSSRWNEFWKSLQQLAEKDHLNLVACWRIERSEKINYNNRTGADGKYIIAESVGSIEQDIQITHELNTYRVTWSGGWKPAKVNFFNFIKDGIDRKNVIIEKSISVVIKYDYHYLLS